MINYSNEREARLTDPETPRSHHKLFCIHSYAGESGPPCGWRGYASEISREKTTGTRRCPRCGRVTLMEIPHAPSA